MDGRFLVFARLAEGDLEVLEGAAEPPFENRPVGGADPSLDDEGRGGPAEEPSGLVETDPRAVVVGELEEILPVCGEQAGLVRRDGDLALDLGPPRQNAFGDLRRTSLETVELAPDGGRVLEVPGEIVRFPRTNGDRVMDGGAVPALLDEHGAGARLLGPGDDRLGRLRGNRPEENGARLRAKRFERGLDRYPGRERPQKLLAPRDLNLAAPDRLPELLAAGRRLLDGGLGAKLAHAVDGPPALDARGVFCEARVVELVAEE